MVTDMVVILAAAMVFKLNELVLYLNFKLYFRIELKK